MSKPIITIYDIETNETIEREMTAAEIKSLKDFETAQEALKIEAETKAAEKAALLEKLGITADEAKLLLG